MPRTNTSLCLLYQLGHTAAHCALSQCTMMHASSTPPTTRPSSFAHFLSAVVCPPIPRTLRARPHTQHTRHPPPPSPCSNTCVNTTTTATHLPEPDENDEENPLTRILWEETPARRQEGATNEGSKRQAPRRPPRSAAAGRNAAAGGNRRKRGIATAAHAAERERKEGRGVCWEGRKRSRARGAAAQRRRAVACAKKRRGPLLYFFILLAEMKRENIRVEGR